jgi:DNA-binding transcriptional ArsR family regulator
MEMDQVISALSALSQETRLKVFKLLIEYGRTGAAAGALSEELDIPHNTLSFHLSHLSNAGLVSSVREGRSIIYSANCDAIEELIGYLGENCCSRETGSGGCGSICKPPSKKGKRE